MLNFLALKTKSKVLPPSDEPPDTRLPVQKTGRGRRVLKFGWLLLIPLAWVGLIGTLAYNEYDNLLGRTQSAANHLQKVGQLAKDLGGGQAQGQDLSLEALRGKLNQVKGEFGAAGQDLAYIKGKVNQYNRVLQLTEKYSPFAADVQTARALVDAGGSFIQAGQTGLGVGDIGLDMLGSLGTRSSQPQPQSGGNKAGGDLLGLGLGASRSQLDQIEATFTKSALEVDQGMKRFNQIPFERLKPGSSLSKTVLSLRSQLPQLTGLLENGLKGIDTVQWLLGYKQPVTYLILLQDADELRPTGGFSGNYAIITLDQGIIGEFVFDNTTTLDNYANAKKLLQVPLPYADWWILPYRWGLRDVNLTPDFPDTAALAQQLLKEEAGIDRLTGVIAINPGVIERSLRLTGPIRVFSQGEYDEVVNAENFASRIHYYQVGRDFEKGESERKKFTRLLAEELIKKIQQLPKGNLVQLGKDLVMGLAQKDLLLYFNNPQAQSWLDEAGWSGRVLADLNSSGFSSDYFYLVETNIASNKTNAFVQHRAIDNIKLDLERPVSHSMELTYDYSRLPPLNSPEAGPNPDYYAFTRYYLPPGSSVRQRQQYVELVGMVEQYNKSVWGQKIVVLPGQVQKGLFGWDSPLATGLSRVNDSLLYRLTIQRQPAARLDLTLNFQPPAGWKINGVTDATGKALTATPGPDNRLKLELGQLQTDLQIIVSLSKNA